MSEVEDLVVTIDVDTTAFHEAMGRAIKAAADYVIAIGPVVSELHRALLQARRRHVRVVTRRKQRNRW